MNLNFQFTRDWSNGQVSFKKGAYVSADIIETGNKAPFTEANPQYRAEVTKPEQPTKVQIPFCFQGSNSIVEPAAAPWLCNVGKIHTEPTPPPGSVTPKGDDYQGPVQSIAAKIFSLRNIIIALVIVVLIGLYLKYGRKKS